MLLARQGLVPLDASDRVLQCASPSFDASIWELFGPLIAGAQLAATPAREKNEWDGAAVASRIKQLAITFVQLVPTQLQDLLEQANPGDLASLQTIYCGGEARSRQSSSHGSSRKPTQHSSTRTARRRPRSSALPTRVCPKTHSPRRPSAGRFRVAVCTFSTRNDGVFPQERLEKSGPQVLVWGADISVTKCRPAGHSWRIRSACAWGTHVSHGRSWIVSIGRRDFDSRPRRPAIRN